jgi:hypothetical protein
MPDPGREDDIQDVGGEAADRVSRLVDGLGDSPFSGPLVIVCLLATFALWVVVLGFPSTVTWVLNRLITSSDTDGTSQRGTAWFLIMGLPFILPFIAVYSIARSRHPDIEDESRIETGMMAGYAYRQRTEKRRQVWLLSGMAGALNCILLILFYKARR